MDGLSSPPLARALYHHTELGDEIPHALYNAVAEVLAYVYQLRRYREQAPHAMASRKAPVPPTALAGPADMDPQTAPSSVSSEETDNQ